MTGRELLAKYLAKQEITGTEFAKRIGVDQSLISCLVTGRRSAGLRVALLIAKKTEGFVPAESWTRKPRKSRTPKTEPATEAAPSVDPAAA